MSCGQCIRAGIACSGYRDTEQLRIRDESQATKQKVLLRKSAVVPQALTATLDDRARNVFFGYYVKGVLRAYDVLDSMFKRPFLDNHLVSSVDAVSLAFYSLQYRDPDATRLATERYLYALSLLNNALKSPDSARKDSTLMAVLLLDLFEKITNNNPRSTDSWMSHVNGALTLVKLRDSRQFRTRIGHRLSVRLSTNLLISCVAANSPAPSALVKLRSDIEPYLDKDDPKWRLSGIIVKYTWLEGDIRDGRVVGPNLLARATALDDEFASLARDMPPSWRYVTAYLEVTSDQELELHWDTYLSYSITQTWNVLRIMRMLVNDMIAEHCSTDDHHFGCNIPRRRSAEDTTAIIDSLARDICASAPQYTRYHGAISPDRAITASMKLNCYTLLFPLYVAASYASSKTRIRPWVIKQLHYMKDEINLRNAAALVEIVETKPDTDIWSVYALLGSYAFAA